MNVVRMNQRNCGGTEDVAPVLYHSGLSRDVAAVAQSLIERDHISRFALVGFSMGGNLVLKLAGEWDQPIAAFLADLKQRGLFDETLILWSGEFGRTPVAELPALSGRRGGLVARDLSRTRPLGREQGFVRAGDQ